VWRLLTRPDLYSTGGARASNDVDRVFADGSTTPAHSRTIRRLQYNFGETGDVMDIRQLRMMMPVALLALSGASVAETASSELDSFLDAYTTTWNAHNGEALAALFTTDADLIMGSLPRVAGRAAIGEWWVQYFSRIDQDRKGAFAVLSSREIAPGVRLANIASRTFGVGKQGKVLDTRLARGTWVLVKKDGAWRIAAMRGLPATGEKRSTPGIDH
jgi:uncharacterized protein (TIGR02246 family)